VDVESGKWRGSGSHNSITIFYSFCLKYRRTWS